MIKYLEQEQFYSHFHPLIAEIQCSNHNDPGFEDIQGFGKVGSISMFGLYSQYRYKEGLVSIERTVYFKQ